MNNDHYLDVNTYEAFKYNAYIAHFLNIEMLFVSHFIIKNEVISYNSYLIQLLLNRFSSIYIINFKQALRPID
jgi:hypothetical protein